MYLGHDQLMLASGSPASIRAPAFGLRSHVPATRPRLDLVVDLGTDLFSPRWWQGVATLLALSSAVAVLAPDLGPLPGGRPHPLGEAEAEQLAAVGIAPIAEGSRTGMAMAETAAVAPLAIAPERASVELFATMGAGDTLGQLLGRSGATHGDAAQAAALVASAGRGPIAPGTSIAITLGAKAAGGARTIQRVSLQPSMALKVEVTRAGETLMLRRIPIALDTTPLRIRGRVGDGLYWSLRSAGASPETVGEYLKALAAQIDVGSEVSPDDRFDLVVANRRSANGDSVSGELLYAGLDRSAASDFQLMRWPVGGQKQWLDAQAVGKPRQQSSALAWPVQARITSGFGLRVHPILRFARMHRGIDFGARWGSPIVAAADGQVVRAGWSGGYGKQVRLAHGSGLVTSYSHMSRIVAPAGSIVRQGQLIGYVGSTGLSTGPHLHYEVYRNGVAVNPMGVRFATRSALGASELQGFRARLQKLLGVGAKQ